MRRRKREPEYPPLLPTIIPSFSMSELTGELIRDMKPPRTLRQWLREELLRRDRGDGKPGATA
jgi:hypothetical protein